MIIFLEEIELVNYRNIEHISCKILSKTILIIGKNGTGKTNFLEAISMLLPGKGLRGAKLDDILKFNCNQWSAKFKFSNCKMGISAIIDMTHSNGQGGRKVRFNEQQIPSGELEKFAEIVWITPQMGSIFLLEKLERKNFFDRIVYNSDASHRINLKKYEHYMQERMKILKDANYLHHKDWLSIIESKIAETSLKIMKARAGILDFMNKEINNLEDEFIKPKLIFKCYHENWAQDCDQALDEKFITICKNKLSAARGIDSKLGKNSFKACDIDFCAYVVNNNQKIDVKLMSTGEQKSILISILLAQINMIVIKKGVAPILLLDEFFVHLDQSRKEYMANYMIKNDIQAFITNTDTFGIESLSDKAQIIKLN